MRYFDKNGNELRLEDIDLTKGSLELETCYKDKPFKMGEVYDSSIDELEEVMVYFPYEVNYLARKEIGKLTDELKKTDYISNKLIEAYALGNFESVKEEYSSKLIERQNIRDRINELEKQLS